MALLDLYRNSVKSFADKVAKVRPDQWDNPTPCAEWDVRDLVNHLVYEEKWSVPLFAGSTIAEVGDRFEGDLLGDDPAAAAAEASEDAQAAVSAPDALDRTVHLSFGEAPAEEYIRQLFADHLVHGWDLAVATGQDRRMDPESVRECLKWFRSSEGGYRSAGLIADRVPVGPDAGDQERLIAGFGRDPNHPSPA